MVWNFRIGSTTISKSYLSFHALLGFFIFLYASSIGHKKLANILKYFIHNNIMNKWIWVGTNLEFVWDIGTAPSHLMTGLSQPVSSVAGLRHRNFCQKRNFRQNFTRKFPENLAGKFETFWQNFHVKVFSKNSPLDVWNFDETFTKTSYAIGIT